MLFPFCVFVSLYSIRSSFCTFCNYYHNIYKIDFTSIAFFDDFDVPVTCNIEKYKSNVFFLHAILFVFLTLFLKLLKIFTLFYLQVVNKIFYDTTYAYHKCLSFHLQDSLTVANVNIFRISHDIFFT